MGSSSCACVQLCIELHSAGQAQSVAVTHALLRPHVSVHILGDAFWCTKQLMLLLPGLTLAQQ